MAEDRHEAGYTLIELVIAFGLFAIVTLGVMTMIATAFRSVVIARSDQIGKNQAEAVLETMRSLPFHRSWATTPEPVDVVDIYFPDLGSGYDGAEKSYTTTWQPTVDMTDGSIEVEAKFILDTEGTVVAPQAAYDHAAIGVDTPPSRLLAVTVTVRWESAGNARSYRLETTVGDKVFTELVGDSHASASGLTAVTQWAETPGGSVTDLSVRALDSSSSVFLGDNIHASSTAIGGRLENAAPDGTTCTAVGANTSVAAPPDSTVPAESASETDLLLPCDTGNEDGASLPATRTLGLSAFLPDGLPSTDAETHLHPSSASSSKSLALYANTVNEPIRQLLADDGSDPVPAVELIRPEFSSPWARTEAEATSTTVEAFESSAELEDIERVRILPTEFAQEGVVQVDLYSASVACTASEELLDSSASGSYSATLRYWSAGEAFVDDGSGNLVPELADDGYVDVPLSATGGPDPLQSVDLASTVVRYDYGTDGLGNPVVSGQVTLADYLHSWSSLTEADVSVEAGSVSAAFSGLVSISTQSVVAIGATEGDISVNLGTLSCSARDAR